MGGKPRTKPNEHDWWPAPGTLRSQMRFGRTDPPLFAPEPCPSDATRKAIDILARDGKSHGRAEDDLWCALHSLRTWRDRGRWDATKQYRASQADTLRKSVDAEEAADALARWKRGVLDVLDREDAEALELVLDRLAREQATLRGFEPGIDPDKTRWMRALRRLVEGGMSWPEVVDLVLNAYEDWVDDPLAWDPDESNPSRPNIAEKYLARRNVVEDEDGQRIVDSTGRTTLEGNLRRQFNAWSASQND